MLRAVEPPGVSAGNNDEALSRFRVHPFGLEGWTLAVVHGQVDPFRSVGISGLSVSLGLGCFYFLDF